MEIFIAVLALVLSLGNLYIQRVHNADSLKPLGQVELFDHKNHFHVYIQNGGVGPMIIDKLTFTKNGNHYSSISDCLDLDPKLYWHMPINDTVKKVILPNLHFIVFNKNTENNKADDIESIKKQLSSITLKVNYHDIYDNKFSFERNLSWFSRHVTDKGRK